MRKALKERILKGWAWEIIHSNYLWKDTAEHIYNTIKYEPIEKAIKIFRKYRNKYRSMACSIYYKRALIELKGKEFIEQ